MGKRQNSRAANAGSSRATRVYADLRYNVVAGILAPGSRLSPAVLAAQYKVSATVVREALTRLTGERFARWSPQQGFTIATATDDEFLHLTKLRTLIDSEGLRLSVAQGDLAWKGELVSAHYMLSNASASDEASATPATKFGNVHQNFHAALISGCGNPCLISVSRQLYDENEIYRHYLRVLYPGALERGSQQHDLLVAAALTGKAEEAVAILVAHYDNAMRGLIDSKMLRSARAAPTAELPNVGKVVKVERGGSRTSKSSAGDARNRKPKGLRRAS
jgi:DNA-binding GntR family transcriptional regulator